MLSLPEIEEIKEGIKDQFIESDYVNSELVIGLVGAIGCNFKKVILDLKERLAYRNYTKVEDIHVSDKFLKSFIPPEDLAKLEGNAPNNAYLKIDMNMNVGNWLRGATTNGILAMAVANHINSMRKNDDTSSSYIMPLERQVYIINSFKNPKEIEIMRKIYGNGFYLLGVYEENENRLKNLLHRPNYGMSKANAEKLITRDEHEDDDAGQQTRETFQESDYFIDNTDPTKATESVYRFIDLIFGHPYITPTFAEYAMYMAYSNSFRSADLSRQVGAAICANNEILALGTNDCPKFGGGLYFQSYNKETKKFEDEENGRDHCRGEDSNKIQYNKLVKDILEKLGIDENDEKYNDSVQRVGKSKLADITEYGRVVHAEMEALTTCSRNNISCRNAEIYVTTFPCHNCAKHIIAAGIKNVYYIEPYPKSKTLEFYDDSTSQDNKSENKLHFMPYFGVGPRKYPEFYAMNLSPLPKKSRKDKCSGKALDWEKEFKETKKGIRSQMLPTSYLEREYQFSNTYGKYYNQIMELLTKYKEL